MLFTSNNALLHNIGAPPNCLVSYQVKGLALCHGRFRLRFEVSVNSIKLLPIFPTRLQVRLIKKKRDLGFNVIFLMNGYTNRQRDTQTHTVQQSWVKFQLYLGRKKLLFKRNFSKIGRTILNILIFLCQTIQGPPI